MVNKNILSIGIFIISLLLLVYWSVNLSYSAVIAVILLIASLVGIFSTEETRKKALTVILFSFLLTLPAAYIVAYHSSIFGLDSGFSEQFKESNNLPSKNMASSTAGTTIQGGKDKTTIMVKLTNTLGTTIVVTDIALITDMPIICNQVVLKFDDIYCNPSKTTCTWQPGQTADLIGVCDGQGQAGTKVKFTSTVKYYPAQSGPKYSKEINGDIYTQISQ